MHVSPITALDVVGTRVFRQRDGSYAHDCLACGSEARTLLEHTTCSNPDCSHVVFSAVDLVASRIDNDYNEAAKLINKKVGRDVIDQHVIHKEQTRRRVLDFWLHKCLRHKVTADIANKQRSLKENGLHLVGSQTGIVIVSGDRIRELVELAEETDAEIPDSCHRNTPSSALLIAVQSSPHTIDRIVITDANKPEKSLIWDYRRVGVVGMLGKETKQYLFTHYKEALRGQEALSSIGYSQEAAALYLDPNAHDRTSYWRPADGRLCAVVSKATDIPAFANFYEAFPKAVTTVRSKHLRSMLGIGKQPDLSWSVMRRSYLAAVIGKSENFLNSDAALLLETSRPSRDEVSWLIHYYRERGKLELAESVKRHMDNKVITKENRFTVRETSSDYLIDYGVTTSSITNFTLQFDNNIFFRGSDEVFHAGRLVYGKDSVAVVVNSRHLENSVELQKSLRQQLYSAKAGQTPESLPTVFEVTSMRRYIFPHLKRQIASLPSKEGCKHMGWSDDRHTFFGPGIRVTMNGRQYEKTVRHPAVQSLSFFQEELEWDVGFSNSLPQTARDIISMILASCARFYTRGRTKPVRVSQSPAARQLLTTMFSFLGQREIFELNPNLRDPHNNHGIRGYPFLVTGFNSAQSSDASFGHVLLSEAGYTVDEDVQQDVAEAAGRSLQFALLRLVEWCIGADASDFHEQPSLDFNSSLLKEGKWIIENVCDLKPWEVSESKTPNLESVLSQIPVSDIINRVTMKDGAVLHTDMRGIRWDRELVRADLMLLNSKCEGEGDELVMDAVGVLPAMETFYGRRPEVSIAF